MPIAVKSVEKGHRPKGHLLRLWFSRPPCFPIKIPNKSLTHELNNFRKNGPRNLLFVFILVGVGISRDESWCQRCRVVRSLNGLVFKCLNTSMASKMAAIWIQDYFVWYSDRWWERSTNRLVKPGIRFLEFIWLEFLLVVFKFEKKMCLLFLCAGGSIFIYAKRRHLNAKFWGLNATFHVHKMPKAVLILLILALKMPKRSIYKAFYMAF